MSLIKLSRQVQARVNETVELLALLKQLTAQAQAVMADQDNTFMIRRIGVEGATLHYPAGTECPLPALESVRVPALCCATIPHGLQVQVSGPTLLLPEPGVFLDLSLVTNVCILTPSQDPNWRDLHTAVFNISSEPILVRKGRIISHLVAL